MKTFSFAILRLLVTYVLISLLVPAVNAQQPSYPKTELLRSSDSAGSKKNLVIIGEGFASGNDQTTFNNWVANEVIGGVFQSGVFWEDMNAFNITRLNAISTDSGVTEVDSSGNVTTTRNTALGYRVSDIWERCWSEPGPNTNSLLPVADFTIIVLNANTNGCRRGNQLAIGINQSWSVLQHEMGHMIGNLCDEYVGGKSPGNYSGGEPGCVNLTKNTNRGTIKWRDFVDPSTALPTTFNSSSMNTTGTVGAFEGGTLGQSGFRTGIWRPTSNGTMRDNLQEFGPVDYNRIKEVLSPLHQYNYLESYTGDFNGDGLSDVVIHNANSIALYLSAGTDVNPTWISTGEIAGWGEIAENDRFFVGDFDNDNKDDLYAINFRDWSIPYLGMLRSTGNGFECVVRYDSELPGWGDMKLNDQLYVADFDGNGMDDLVVFNGQDFEIGYLIMLRSTGSFLEYVARYDDKLPGWDSMAPHDRFFPADFDGNGLEDLYIFNGSDWAVAYLQLMRSTGTELESARRFDDKLPGWDSMRTYDHFFPADFDGNGTVDLYVFNGRDWNVGYLSILRYSNNDLVPVSLYEDVLPGWDRMLAGDEYYVADIDGNKRQDLYVYNHSDWDSEYLGEILSDGNGGLVGYWQEDVIGSWNLGSEDQFLAGNFSGGLGWDDLFIRNGEWFGLLRSHVQTTNLVAIYPKWIHQVAYHSWGWW